MIDWFPPIAADAAPDDRGRLERWHGVVELRRLACVADARDPRGADHSPRVADLTAELAVELGWSGPRVAAVREAALVRDVGAVCGDPAGEAEPGEHAAMGARIASTALGPDAVRWVRHHHERWDGAGGPDRLRGPAIPDGAQVIALADAYDLLRHGSWEPLTSEEALARCREERGRRFAPWAVDALEMAVRRHDAGGVVMLAPLKLVPV